ncbi:MAG: universal stress protein, partial [Prochlorococcus sp.]
MFETVLFPIDQSREAMETASKALELARSHGSRLIILSVVQAERPEM